jgi:hypothetical protein
VADQKISALNNLTAATIADADELVICDVDATETKALALSETIIRKWTAASSAGAASLQFHEDTDNGSNKVTLSGPASTADVTVVLPATAGTLQLETIVDSGSLITATTVDNALQEGFSGKCAVNTVAATGATETLTDAPIQKMTMDQNCTFTFPTPTTAGHIFMLHLLGAFTPTFPGTVDWPDASPPTYTTPSIYVFVTDDTGTTWFGSQVGKAFG